MALPKEIQELLDYLNEEEPFELNHPSLSPQLLVETACKWLTSAVEQAQRNPRLVGRSDDTAKKLLDLARQFAWLKEEKPSK